MGLLTEKIKYLDAWTSQDSVKLSYRDGDGRLRYETIEDYGRGGWYFYITMDDYECLGSEVISAFEDGTFYHRLEDCVRFVVEDKKWVRVHVNNKNLNDRYSTRADDRKKLKKLFENDGIKCFEADLKPHKRYCIDENIQVADNYKILYYDIEIDDRNPGIVIGRDKILTIAGVDQDGKEFFFHDENEETLLQAFHDHIRWDYDILVGYNSDNFDKPYILARYKEHFMDEAIGHFRYRSIHLDLMQIFIKRFAGESDITSWSLEFISRYFLGHGKLEGGPTFGNGRGYQFYLDEFQKFKEYNIMDARNLYDLNKVLHIVDQIILECQITGCFPSRVSISELLDCFILRSVRDKGIHFASIEFSENQIRCPKCNHVCQTDEPVEEIVGAVQCARCGENFEPNTDDDIAGAFVFDPVPGLHDNVYVFDYKALYPSIIRTWNIGPDTFLEPAEHDKINDLEQWHHYLKSANDQYYLSPERTISTIKSAVEKLLDLRKQYKTEMMTFEAGTENYKAFNAKQNAVKMLCNSMYGLMGYKYGRFYRKEIAEAITLGGQWLNKHTKVWFENKGHKVIYGDSVTEDRVFLCRSKASGQIFNISIGDIYNSSKCYQKLRGKEHKYDVPYQTISVSKTGDVEFKDIKSICRHETNKPVYRVYNNKGVTCVTEDHSLIDHNLERKTFRELDTLFSIKSKIGELGASHATRDVVDIYPYLKDEEITGFGNGVSKRFVVDGDYIYLESCKSGNRNSSRLRRYYEGSSLESLCRLLGLYVSEGSSSTPQTTSSRYMLSFSNDNQSVLAVIEADLYVIAEGLIFNTVKSSDKDNTYKTISGSQVMAEFFRIIGGQRSRGKYIIPFMFNLKREYQGIFLDWVIFGDGWREDDPKYSDRYRSEMFRYDTTSDRLMTDMCSLLSLNGFCYSLRYRQEKECWTICTSYNNRDKPVQFEQIEYSGPVYDLEVDDNHNFFDAAGFIGLHNTDSVFVRANNLKREDIDDLLTELHEFYDDALDEYFGIKEHFIELEYEKLFDRLLLIKKKNYVGSLVELDGKPVNKFVVKGLECIKRDTVPLGKKWQRELVELIIKGEQKASWYHKWVQERMDYFHSDGFDIENIIIRKKLTKHPNKYKTRNAHADIAKEMMSREMECYVGMSIPFIVIEDKPLKAVHPDWYEPGTASITYYWDRQIYSILQRVLDVAFPNEDWGGYSTKISAKRVTKRERFARWLKDPKKKRSEMLLKLNADKDLSKDDKRKLKKDAGIRVAKAKVYEG